MNSHKLLLRWSEQQRSLLRDLEHLVKSSQRRGTSEDIHRLRVTARRLRLFVQLGSDHYGRKLVRAFCDWARTLADATDAVRDLDATGEWLAQQPDTRAALKPVMALRNRRIKPAQQALSGFPPRLRARLRLAPSKAPADRDLHDRFQRLLKRLEKKARTQSKRFSRLSLEEQHSFRRMIRRWRYLRELELPRRGGKRPDALLERLLALQGVLGDRQNLLLADTILSRLKPNSGINRARELAQATAEELIDNIKNELKWLKD